MRSKASGEGSERKVSTSPGVGGSPVRSQATLRIKVRCCASGARCNPWVTKAASINRSIGCSEPKPVGTGGDNRGLSDHSATARELGTLEATPMPPVLTASAARIFRANATVKTPTHARRSQEFSNGACRAHSQQRMEKFEPMGTWQKDAINSPFHPSPVSKRAQTMNPWPTPACSIPIQTDGF